LPVRPQDGARVAFRAAHRLEIERTAGNDPT